MATHSGDDETDRRYNITLIYPWKDYCRREDILYTFHYSPARSCSNWSVCLYICVMYFYPWVWALQSGGSCDDSSYVLYPFIIGTVTFPIDEKCIIISYIVCYRAVAVCCSQHNKLIIITYGVCCVEAPMCNKYRDVILWIHLRNALKRYSWEHRSKWSKMISK